MIQVRLPKTSDEYEESLIVFWNVQEGDQIRKGDLLLEVQTEKAIFEIEAESDGIIKEILLKRGESAKVNDLLAIMEPVDADSTNPLEEIMKSAPQEETEHVDQEIHHFVRVTPRLRKLASDLKVDLSLIQGTGANGALTEEDIRDAASIASEITSATGKMQLTGIRATIARRMVDSLQNSAQLTETTWADVSVLAVKKNHSDVDLSWNTIVLYNVINALKKHSELNAHLIDNIITRFEHINLGIAVDTPNGLLVPVVKNAQCMSMFELQEEVNRLVNKAKEGNLSHTEMSGSTFTVSNLGIYGIQFFTPIINPPEVAILGIGQIERYIALEQGQIVQKQRLPLSLTFDHRAIDGAPAARFLQTLVYQMENSE